VVLSGAWANTSYTRVVSRQTSQVFQQRECLSSGHQRLNRILYSSRNGVTVTEHLCKSALAAAAAAGSSLNCEWPDTRNSIRFTPSGIPEHQTDDP